MRKFFYVLSVFALFASVNLFAQQNIFHTQGHPREDVMSKYNMFEKAQRAVRAEINYDPDFTFKNIDFWVGTGSDSAALVVDWYLHGGNETYVWGYLFDGEAYGIDMLEAIAAADSRFYMLLYGGTQYGTAIGGIGYDREETHIRCLLLDTTPVCAGADGIIHTQQYNFDAYTAFDKTAYWRSGWYDGYWSYQVRDSGNVNYEYSQPGASSRKLVNGSWDSWAYQEGWESWVGVLPRSPYIAAPRP